MFAVRSKSILIFLKSINIIERGLRGGVVRVNVGFEMEKITCSLCLDIFDNTAIEQKRSSKTGRGIVGRCNILGMGQI